MSPRKPLKKEAGKAKKGSRKRRNLDSAWKEIIEKFFKDTMELLFPRIYATIDFSKKPQFLDTELRPLAPFGRHGDRAADVLAKVQLKDGEYNYIRLFIHIEVQAQPQENLMERIFIYNYRFSDKRLEEGVPVISLLILADDDANYRPDEHKVSFGGFKLRMKVPMVKLLDFKLKKNLREKLAKSASPIAVVIRTQLKSMELKKADEETRLAAVGDLLRECYNAGFSREIVHTMVKFLVWVIGTSKDDEKKLKEEFKKIEEDMSMPYMIPWELTAEKRGRRKGKVEGIEQKAKEAALRMLDDGLPIDRIAKYTGLPYQEIEKLSAAAH